MTDIYRMANRITELEDIVESKLFLTDDEVRNLYLYIQNQYIDRSENERIPYNGHIVTTFVTRLGEYNDRLTAKNSNTD